MLDGKLAGFLLVHMCLDFHIVEFRSITRSLERHCTFILLQQNYSQV